MDKTKITFYGCQEDERETVCSLAPHLRVEPVFISEDVSPENASLANGCCVSVGHRAEIGGPTLAALKDAGVEFLSTRSIGTNHIDIAAAERLGIRIENVRYTPEGVADYTVMLMLMALRGTKGILLRAQRMDFRLPPSRGQELEKLTVGVVGTGSIGSAVIRRLRGFGCRILAFDPRPGENVRYVSLDTLLKRSDIITLHVPLTDQTRHLIGASQIRKMKPAAILVNTARGALVDTAALTEALASGKLGGAALDVVEGEEALFYEDHGADNAQTTPLGLLSRLPNVILSPHTAYYTEGVLLESVQKSILSCLRFAGGEGEKHHE